ncbi:MAG TPA: hypothetical protein VFK05_20870, partial [Polyangiaceae bacterium]|nr:hypothetical protein [Polyangiaceae bacterium]
IIVPPVDGVAGMGDCDPGDFLKLPPNCGQVPLTPTNGWIDGQNAAHIQGAVFAFADATSALGMSMDFTGANACIQGTAAKVDMASEACLNHTFTPPATDCYGEYWGAAIGMNLNQTIDPTTMMGNTPAPFDASALQGFSFELTGNVLPGPNALRFVVENEDKQFCNPSSVKLRAGSNTVLFSELFSRCFTTTDPPQPSAETVKSALIRISWQVVTNSSSTTPFDFCVSNVRALPR